jgi:hypothetical protein
MFDIKVGDSVRYNGGYGCTGAAGVVVYIDHGWYVVDDGDELSLYSLEELEKVRTFPERWINVYPQAVSEERLTRESADLAATPFRIGVIHLHSDGTLTMEQP